MMLVGLCVDILIGWPDWLYRRIGHPVTWMGHVIALCDRKLNDGLPDQRRQAGHVTLRLVLLLTIVPALVVQFLLPATLIGILLGGLLAWPFIAARSMWTHVRAVAIPLEAGDLAGARRAVSKIVGRDPDQLGRPGVARAALESLAENSSDGIVAPVFWGTLLGLPGLVGYKAINTLDSMIGHRNKCYTHFGRAAARLDDWVNWAPARLTAWMIALARPLRFWQALRVMRQDARRHRSPNAGWPEAAMAGSLGIRLSGPRRYGTEIVDEPWLNGDAPNPDPGAIRAGLRIYLRCLLMLALSLLGLALLGQALF